MTNSTLGVKTQENQAISKYLGDKFKLIICPDGTSPSGGRETECYSFPLTIMSEKFDVINIFFYSGLPD